MPSSALSELALSKLAKLLVFGKSPFMRNSGLTGSPMFQRMTLSEIEMMFEIGQLRLVRPLQRSTKYVGVLQ